ncbi:MAG: hypothetical protein LBE55_00250, partial [Clostridiales bacterium]|nr:hypothetical protein [Clostridiales bacterium]
MDKRRQARPPARPPVRASSQKAPARRPVRRPPGKPVKNRKKRPKRDITLAIFEFVANIGGWIKRGYLRARNMRHFRVFSTFAGIAFAIFAVSLVFFLATRPNALEIYLDEASIGTVRLEGAGRDLTLEYITRHA